MSLKAGIVGLPNVGKSTLFNAITKLNILAANYPFATIEPNVGAHMVLLREIAAPDGGEHLLRYPAVKLRHTIHLLTGVAGEG